MFQCAVVMKDFGMMADMDEEDRYGLFGLVIGLQNRDLPLVTENLLKVSRCEHLLSATGSFISPNMPNLPKIHSLDF